MSISIQRYISPIAQPAKATGDVLFTVAVVLATAASLSVIADFDAVSLVEKTLTGILSIAHDLFAFTFSV